MANTIKIKRGLKTNLPSLELGELAYCTDTKELFIGTASGNEIVHADTSTQADVDNSANANFIKSLTFDDYGHVTGLTSTEITSVANATVADTVDNANSASNLTLWTGTQSEYDNLTPDANTLYFIEE